LFEAAANQILTRSFDLSAAARLTVCQAVRIVQVIEVRTKIGFQAVQRFSFGRRTKWPPSHINERRDSRPACGDQNRSTFFQPRGGSVGAASEQHARCFRDVLQRMINIQHARSSAKMSELFFPDPLRGIRQNRDIGSVENAQSPRPPFPPPTETITRFNRRERYTDGG
jgi:hypothetical protein